VVVLGDAPRPVTAAAFGRPVVLHAAGGRRLGLGHLRRCATLAGALVAAGARVTLVAEAEDDVVARFAVDGATLVTAADRAAALDARAGRGATLVTDLLGLGPADAELARAQGFSPLVHVNDDLAGGFQPDLAVLGDVHATTWPGDRRARRVLAGARWHCVDPTVAALRPADPRPAEEASTVLLAMSGADPGQVTEAVLGGLGALGWPLRPTVVAGPAFGAARARALAATLAGAGELVLAPPSLGPLLAEAELVLTLGGLTAYEAMCLGRPVGVVAWPPLAAAVRPLLGTGVVAGLAAGAEAAAGAAALAADAATLGRLAGAGWRLVDGLGAGRVAQVIAEAADARVGAG
jgi:spore coat polysaccharide biosynthesis predicted glycosyltransferase SpsG